MKHTEDRNKNINFKKPTENVFDNGMKKQTYIMACELKIYTYMYTNIHNNLQLSY